MSLLSARDECSELDEFRFKSEDELRRIVNDYENRSEFKKYFLDIINPFSSVFYNYEMAGKVLAEREVRARNVSVIECYNLH